MNKIVTMVSSIPADTTQYGTSAGAAHAPDTSLCTSEFDLDFVVVAPKPTFYIVKMKEEEEEADSWFTAPSWLHGEVEADLDLQEGNYEEFTSVEQAINFLNDE